MKKIFKTPASQLKHENNNINKNQRFSKRCKQKKEKSLKFIFNFKDNQITHIYTKTN